jgi:hypothetical protein
VDLPSVFQLVMTGLMIVVGEMCIESLQQVGKFEIGSMCHQVDDSLQSCGDGFECGHHVGWFTVVCGGAASL